MTSQSPKTLHSVDIDGVRIHLAHPDELPIQWVGQEELIRQLMAAWMVVNNQDLPMNPRLLGKPGVGKTTLAYAVGKRLGREVYILQATLDTRPEEEVVRRVQDLMDTEDFIKLAFGTEGGLFQQRLGLATVICGPGSMDQGHKPDEFVARSELARCDVFLGKLLDQISAQ